MIMRDLVQTRSTVPDNTPEVGGREPGYGSGPRIKSLRGLGEAGIMCHIPPPHPGLYPGGTDQSRPGRFD